MTKDDSHRSETRAFERQIDAIAATSASVLLIGSTGSGKEQAARRVHDHSQRRDQRFVIAPCNAIPKDRFEADFFGYLKGAFTGAYRDHVGYLGQADGGTLFLDEIDKLSVRDQGALLRPLDGYGYRQLGSEIDQRSDIRIVAATNRNLLELCRNGQFLLDLYGRIAKVEISLPEVRQRVSDVRAAAENYACHFLGEGLVVDSIETGELTAGELAAQVGEAAAALCAVPGAWVRGFRGVEGFAAQALICGIEQTMAAFRIRWEEDGSFDLGDSPASVVGQRRRRAGKASNVVR